jgi:hypothetical protein
VIKTGGGKFFRFFLKPKLRFSYLGVIRIISSTNREHFTVQSFQCTDHSVTN